MNIKGYFEQLVYFVHKKRIMKSFYLIVLFAFVSTQATIPVCNVTQISGITHNFSISATNVNGTIDYFHPSGCPVKRIKSDIVLVDTVLNTTYEPLLVVGVPVKFPLTGSDVSGTINVSAPDDIPTGDNYVYRATLRSIGTLCTIDTGNFTIEGSFCEPGSTVCNADGSGFTECFQTNDTNETFSYNLFTPCAFGTTCQQVDNITAGCEVTLTNATDVGTGMASTDMTESETASIGTIAVSTEEVNTTTPIETLVASTSAVNATAVEPTTVATLQLDTTPTTTTVVTIATSTSSVTDQCVLGTAQCVTIASNQVCVSDNSTGAAIFGPVTNCTSGSTCSSATGFCTLGNISPPFSSSCIPYSQICLSDTLFDSCVFSDQGVWELSGVTETCPSGTICEINSVHNDTIICSSVNASPRRRYFNFLNF
ncbi:hypothetical protein BDK51DRAFT_46003 [Blyttiomyces helicus]|uniref:Uncharacterized protein n=1 Tax=Blyttiomyces helicus TaxID=388810 RepID=A0A4P9WKF2_9FUNG|nr:hypothetical protein BDK51DRAFT_46003 [Blyttiomyces helicus]|eukprot:RKO92595.1 hypothetical protein BDK51DRAFT_46003 [Blyttiomyces helicus]